MQTEDKIIVLDVETQNSFKDVGGRSNLAALKISVAVAFWYPDQKFHVFMEDEMEDFEKLLIKADTIVGFNTIGFDNPVIQPYMKQVRLDTKNQIDMMLKIEEKLGYKISLDSIAGATLGHKKLSHGLEAIKMYREGRMDELTAYCQEDVNITKEIFEYGRKNKSIKFNAGWEDYEIEIDW
jgi:DEAD/DEAH box helicase domain-containing protein